jgi:hypothetical protein
VKPSTRSGPLPQRDPRQFAQDPLPPGPEARLVIDGTDRRRQRANNPEKQAAHYTGKRKAHTDKNVVVVDARSKRVGFLSGTYAGRTHDKRVADEEGISYLPGTGLYKDTGFQGYEPTGTPTRQANTKATPRGADGGAEAVEPKLARIRVKVEHALAGVKRSRAVKDVLRNTKEGVSDSVMAAACGLHNLRVQKRKKRLKQ